MRKVIAIFDEPKTCLECPLLNNYICRLQQKNVNGLERETGENGWVVLKRECPLKEFPEFMQERKTSEYDFGSLGKGYEVGWNNCLNKILN